MIHDLSDIPIFGDLTEIERGNLLALAHQHHIEAGETLFYEGDPADDLYLLTAGRCALSWAGEPRGEVHPGGLLDPLAALGGLPHTVKAVTLENCDLLSWDVTTLWQSDTFSATTRRYLASSLHQSEHRRRELEAPIHYTGDSLSPGPFIFEDMTMVIAFCEANQEIVRATLPDGLSLLKSPLRDQAPVFIAFADFPLVYPQHDESACFAYTETTYFVPARHKANPGVYAPFIYPSSWEPILLGREIYGFPKRLGRTMFGSNQVSLSVDGKKFLDLHWTQLEAGSEPQIVGALVEWLGFERHIAAAAFQAGDLMRRAMRLPPYRRVDVFNHKRVLAVAATHDDPKHDVDCLTQAVFGVLRWNNIARINDPVLEVSGGPLVDAGLVVREAYRTGLAMRLSAGRVVRDYRDF